MSGAKLLASTGSDNADEIVGRVISAYDADFPSRVHGYYLIGSYATATTVGISDIDMIVLFKERFADDAEEGRARELGREMARESSIRLDLVVTSDELLRPEDVRLKLASVLVYGEDIRDKLPLPSVQAYRRYITTWPNGFLARLHDTQTIVFPLDYPDAQGEFYGYDRKRVAHWYPPSVERGTKELVATICWAATATVALRLGEFAGRKTDAIKLYQKGIGGEYAGFLQELYDNCSQRWGYLIPEAIDGRRHLRELCRQALGFENHYLSVYKAYLLEELQDDDTSKLFAVERLGQVIYPDDEVTGILRAITAITEAGHGELSDAAGQALRKIEVNRR